MSVLETVRKVQEAEAEAEAILAAARVKADEEVARSRREAARLVEAAGDDAREQLERLRELSRAEEEVSIAGIESAARAEMAEVRARAARNRAAATAILAGLAARLAGEGG
jgi:F0F1-type ATP synthase membrane subunit b/b'